MSSALLTTKLFTPTARPNLVPRPRLVQKLDEGLIMGRRLTLVSAPAGYGKTTLVSAWLQTSEQRFSWLSLDSGDNELARFFAYLVAALQKVDVGVTLALIALLVACATATQDPSPTPDAVLVDSEWVLISLEGSALIADTQITLNLEEVSLDGSAGCNTFRGSYSVSEDSLRLAPWNGPRWAARSPRGSWIRNRRT